MADQYRCDRCNQSFSDEQQYKDHNQQQHQGQMPGQQGQQQGGQQQQNR